MAVYSSSLMTDSLNRELIRETEACGDVRRIVLLISAAQLGNADSQFILGRVKWNSAIHSITITNLSATAMTDITYRIGVWCHNPDIVSVGNAAGSYLTTTEAVLNLDTFGGTTAPAGLLTGPGCFLSTNTDGTVIDGAGYRPGANSGSVSGVIDLSFVAAAGNTSILSKARQQVTIKQIVDGLDDATNAQNVTKTVARRNLFAGNTPYSNVDCLIVLDMAVVPGAGGPLLFTIEYVEGTVSNMVSIKTSPVYP